LTFPGELADDQTWTVYGHNANLEIGGPATAFFASLKIKTHLIVLIGRMMSMRSFEIPALASRLAGAGLDYID
jgi:hypothetical protein